MELKHTPGPWVDGQLEDNDCCEVMDERGYYIATCHDGVRGERNADANARLIAAAPDLLEALQELANCGAEAWGEDRPCVHIARAAIAKATGQQP